MATKEEVLRVLDGINDPELNKSFTELDMVKSVTVEGSDVTIGITLTVPGCPMKARITDDITKGVKAIAGVESVRVELDAMTD